MFYLKQVMYLMVIYVQYIRFNVVITGSVNGDKISLSIKYSSRMNLKLPLKISQSRSRKRRVSRHLESYNRILLVDVVGIPGKTVYLVEG